MDIVIASTNPVKQEAVSRGFARMFSDQHIKITGTSASSGVADQPFSDEEAYRGAYNRARNAQNIEPDAAYWVGIEAGVHEIDDRYGVSAWVAIIDADDREGSARSAFFFLPKMISDYLHQGYELTEAGDAVFNESEIGKKHGIISMLTQGEIDRATFYVDAVVLALIPFFNIALYEQ